jgi:DNA-binding NarL/FixJ family response regulator
MIGESPWAVDASPDSGKVSFSTPAVCTLGHIWLRRADALFKDSESRKSLHAKVRPGIGRAATHHFEWMRIGSMRRLGGVSAHTANDVVNEESNCMSVELPAPLTRILIVDDHSIVRDGLAVLIEREPGLKVVGFAGSGEEAVTVTQRLRPDLIIMDLMLPALNGIDATRRIISEFPQTRIIALSACHTPEQVSRALRAGALGFVLKTEAATELLRAVQMVTAGKEYVSPAITALFVGGALSMPSPKSPFERLSSREREVVQLVVAGSTSSDIALQLSLSRKTVDTYRARIMVKLGVANRSALIRFALEYELPPV